MHCRAFKRDSAIIRLATAVALAMVLGLALSYGSLAHTGHWGPKRSDYVAYYGAGKLVVTGHGADIYRFAVLGRVEQQLVHPLKIRDGVLPFVYPPFVAVALAPLAALPFATSWVLWLVINLGALVVSLVFLQGEALVQKRGRPLLWLGALGFLPVSVSLLQGQVSLLLLALLIAVYTSARSGRDKRAGLFLALMSLKAPYMLVLLLLFARRGRWRLLGACACTLIVLYLAPLPVLGTTINLQYGHILRLASSWNDQFGYAAIWNQSFEGFSQLLLPGTVGTLLTAVLDAGALVIFCLLGRRSEDFSLAFAAAVVVSLLVSPHVLVHDLALLVLPVGIALRKARDQVGSLPYVLAIGYGAILFGLHDPLLGRVQTPVLAVLAFAVWLLLTATRGEGRRLNGSAEPESVQVGLTA